MKFFSSAIFSLCLLAASPVFSRDFEGVVVGNVNIENASGVDDEKIRAFLPFESGVPYSSVEARRGLMLLSRKPEIRNVIISGREREGVLDLDIKILAEPLVQSISFSGGPPMDKAELLSRIVSRVDRPVIPASLARDARIIIEKLIDEGFPEAEVNPSLQLSSTGHWINLTFEINPGRPLLVSEVVFRGLGLGENSSLQRSVLLRNLGLDRGDVASVGRLKEGAAKLKEYLWDKGWLEAKIIGSFFEPDGDRARVVFHVEQGKPAALSFRGVGMFKKADFNKLAKRRFGRKIDKKWAERLVSNMVDQLRSEGRYGASARFDLDRKGEKTQLVFHIDPGPTVRTLRMDFEGNNQISTEELKEYSSALDGSWIWRRKLTDEVVGNDLKTIVNLYSSQGFMDAVATLKGIDVDEKGNASVAVKIEEGQKYVWGDILFFLGDAISVSEAEKTTGLQWGAPADLAAAGAARSGLEQKLRNNGYPNAKVNVQWDVNPLTARVGLRFYADAGNFVRHGKIVVSGNSRTKTKVVLRELEFASGDPWRAEAVSESVRNLYALGYLTRVRAAPIEPIYSEDVWDAQVLVEERDAGKFSLGFGYGTEEGVRASGAISHENFWGYGRSVGLRADLDELEQSYALNFREPRLFNRRLNFGLSLLKSYQQQEAYTLSSTALQSSLEKDLSEEVKARLIYTLESDELLGDEKGAVLVSAIGPVLAWDTRDDPFNPRKGAHHTVQVELATDALGSEVRYERYTGTASVFFSKGRATLAMLARGGILFTLAQTPDVEDVLKNKLFFLGGRGTVRGFERNSIGPMEGGIASGGDTMLNLKSELRFPLWKSLGGAVFWDAGNVWDRAGERPDFGDLRQAAGGGIRLATPVGPVALDVGFKLDMKPDEDPYVWHFTIGNVF